MKLNGSGGHYPYHIRCPREDNEEEEAEDNEEEEAEDNEEEEAEEVTRRKSDTQKKSPYATAITFIGIAITLMLCFDCILSVGKLTPSGLPSGWSYMFLRSKYRSMETAEPYHYDHTFRYSNLSVGRKLLRVEGGRLSGGGGCTVADLAILQGETTPLPDGIPSFSVQVINLCSRSRGPCSSAYDIHVSCGWFASAKLVNPRLFRRLRFNDCIVNDRQALRAGQSITFEYSNSFQYPLSISSAITGCH